LFYDYWTFPSFSVQAAFLFFSRCLADTPTSLNSDKDIISEEEGIDEKEDFNTNPVDGDDDNIIPIKLYTNADTQKLDILNENKSLSGIEFYIYKI
jgi:hypothetical protein